MPEGMFDAEALAFDTPPRDRAALEAETLNVNVDGFEGPLDLLLTLARTQKVDLRRVSVLQLAEQYLSFIGEARWLRIELAADYLVMAACLPQVAPGRRRTTTRARAARSWRRGWPSSSSASRPCAGWPPS